MADTFSLRFEIDASRAEAGAKKFVSAINAVNKSLDNLDAKADAAFSKLMAGGSSGGDFTKLAKDLNQLNKININPAAVKSINSIGTAFKNLKGPSPASLKNLTNFANTVPALLNRFNVSGNFSDSINKLGTAMAGFKVPSQSKVDAFANFGAALQKISPSLRVSGNFGGIEKLGAALGSFRAPSEKAVANMRAFFNALNNSGAKASINSSLVNGIVNLSGAMAGLKSPSSTSVKNLRDLFSTLATFKPVTGTSSISKVTAAFAGFKGPTPAQIKNVQAFVTMLGNLKVPANAPQIAAYIEKIGMAAGTANKFLNNFRISLGSIGAGKFGNEARGLTTNLRGLENAFSGTFQAASVFRTMIGSITLGTLSKSIYDANTQFMAFKSTMSAVTGGNIKATGDEMRYVEDMANRLGQRVQDVQESYGGFSVSASLAGVSQDQTRKVFESTVTAMTVLHRSSDRTKLALLALEQMMSKGTVSSEELRRQLGEQLPGAVNLMARALKVSTSELADMLKAGEVLSADALPKFAAEVQKTYGPSLAGALHNAVSQFNLLANAVYGLQIVMGQSGAMDALAGAFAKIKDAISAPEFVTFASEFGERTAAVITKLGDGFAFLIKHIDWVIFGLKGLLALNIARFLQSFGSLVLGNITSTAMWARNLSLLGTAFTGVTATASGASVAVGIFGRVGALLAGLATGPIGAVVLALGTLGAMWYSTSQKGTEFSTVVDMSKESLDRYKDTVATYTTMQIVNEQQKVKQAMLESQQAAAQSAAEVQRLISAQGRGGGGAEFSGLVKQFREVQRVVKETGGDYSEFARQLAETHFNTPAAQSFANAIIEMGGAQDQAARATEYGKEKLDALQGTLSGMNASNAVAQLSAVASAASSMAGVVASAANEVAAAFAKMNMSKAQSVMADKFIDLSTASEEAMDKVNKSSMDAVDKDKQISRINNETAKSFAALNEQAEKLYSINQKMDTNKSIDNMIENYGKAATESGNKIADLRKKIEEVKNSSRGSEAERGNVISVLQKQIADAEKQAAKEASGGKGKGKGKGAGGAASYLDDAGKATAKYNKEQDGLDRMLKKGTITQDQYNTAIDKLKEKYSGTGVAGDVFVSDFEKLRNELNPANTAINEFAKNQDILKQAMDQGKISGEEYLDLLTRLQKKYSEARTGSSWVDGINKGLTDLTKTSDDFVNDVAGAVSNAFNGLEDALTEWVTTGKLDFKSLATSIMGDIAKIVIRYTVIQPIIRALSGAFGGSAGATGSSGGGFFGSIIGSLFGGANAMGNAFNNGKIIPFAKGGLTNGSNSGIVNSPTLFEMSGKRTGLMGEAGAEGILPLKRNSKGELGVSASGAVQAASSNVYVQPKVNISINNQSGNSEASASTQQNADGSLDINILVEKIKDSVAGDVSKGGTNINRAFEGRYGANAAAGNKR